MAIWHTVVLLAALAGDSQAAEYRFETSQAEVKLEVNFLPPYQGAPLQLYSGQQSIPAAALGFAKKPEQFTGAGALVRYSVRYRDGKRKAREIREKVTLLGQSEDLPAWSPFHKKVSFVQGVASDLQLFGYDEEPIAEEHRVPLRDASRTCWRRFRQELFLDGASQPFAVLEWTHTIAGIRLEPVR